MSGKIPVTVVILTKNEERSIQECLDSVAEFDQVLVIDSASDDATVELSEQAGAQVIPFAWNGQYPKKKQWALQHPEVAHPWVLHLDADERPDAALVAEIRDAVAGERAHELGAFDIRLRYMFAGRFLAHGHTVVKRALVHRDRARFPEVGDLDTPGIREVEGHYQPETSAPVGKLRGRINHADRDPVESWFERHNRYSTWEAHLRRNRELEQLVASKRTRRGQAWSKVPFKPLVFFLYSYVARAGFLDGRAGFDYAVALSTYYWQIGVKYRELAREDNDQ